MALGQVDWWAVLYIYRERERERGKKKPSDFHSYEECGDRAPDEAEILSEISSRECAYRKHRIRAGNKPSAVCLTGCEDGRDGVARGLWGPPGTSSGFAYVVIKSTGNSSVILVHEKLDLGLTPLVIILLRECRRCWSCLYVIIVLSSSIFGKSWLQSRPSTWKRALELSQSRRIPSRHIHR